jgi:hypothetical protein
MRLFDSVVLFDEGTSDMHPVIRNRKSMIPTVKNFIFLDLLKISLMLKLKNLSGF